jgi:hypothetical protein
LKRILKKKARLLLAGIADAPTGISRNPHEIDVCGVDGESTPA